MEKGYIQEKLKMYQNFQKQWSLSRMKDLKLEEYTNSDNNSFIYDIEFGTKALGSIKGRNAFIFGIFKRQNLSEKESSERYIYGKEYAWLGKFGADESEAFENVKTSVIDVIENAQDGNYSVIDRNPLDSMYKWKITYLYQKQEDISITPVFTKAALELYAKKIGKYEEDMTMSELYLTIKEHENYKTLEDAIYTAEIIWDEFLNFDFDTAKEIVNNASWLSETKKRNATSDLELIEYEIKAHKILRRNLHNKLEKSFRDFLTKRVNAQSIIQDEDYIDFQFILNNQKYICELKPSDNKKEIKYAVQSAIGQILGYSFNRNYDYKIIVFQGEPDENQLNFLDYLKNEHNIYFLYEVSYGKFYGNIDWFI